MGTVYGGSTYGSVYGSGGGRLRGAEALGEDEGGAFGGSGMPGGPPSDGFYYRTHRDFYPANDQAQNFAAMLLSLLLRISHPDMTMREELMIRGQKPAPGVSEENLQSQNVSPLAIRRHDM